MFFSIILEADSGAVVQRVALRTDDIPIGEQTVAQVSWLPAVAFKWFCHIWNTMDILTCVRFMMTSGS